MAIQIRLATSADLPAAARLAVGMVRFHHELDPDRFMLPEPVQQGYERFLAGQLGDPLSVVLVAESQERGELVGYAYGRLEPRSWEALLDRCGWLHDLYVDEADRRHGVAVALVDEMVLRLRAMGAPRVVLHVAEHNPVAQRLFARLGFRPTMRELTLELAGLGDQKAML